MSNNEQDQYLAESMFETKVAKLVCVYLEVESCKLTDDIESDLGADSMDFVELIMYMEEQFEVQIDDSIAQDLHTVLDIVSCLRSLGCE